MYVSILQTHTYIRIFIHIIGIYYIDNLHKDIKKVIMHVPIIIFISMKIEPTTSSLVVKVPLHQQVSLIHASLAQT